MASKAHSNPSNAHRAAERALDGDAVDGVDFRAYQASGRRRALHVNAEEEADQGPGPKSAKPRLLGKRPATEAAAREGRMPTPPGFSATTHARYCKRLADVVALAEAGDLKALADYPIKPYCTSPKAIARYRDHCVLALKATAKRDLRKQRNVD